MGRPTYRPAGETSFDCRGARIAIIGPAYPLRGGNALFTAHLYDCLRSDHDVYVVSYKRLYPSLLFPGKTQLNVSRDPVKSTPSRQLIDSIGPLSWRRTARWITAPSRAPELIIFVWWNPFFGICCGMIARMLKRRTKAGIVFVAENVVSHENRFLDKFLTRFALSTADYFMVLSGVVAQRIQGIFPTVPLRQAALPMYGCYGERADGDSVRKTLGLTKPTILFFGYVREYKGLRYLLRAMPEVLESIDAELLIVGEFYEDRGAYDRLIAELNLGENVRIVADHVPDEAVAGYFAAADVVVLPYVSATQSGITQIAFAYGVPVISTNVGGLPEVVEDDHTGYIVEPRDEKALAAAIVRYFAENKRDEFSRNVLVEAKRDSAGELMRKAVSDFLEMERG